MKSPSWWWWWVTELYQSMSGTIRMHASWSTVGHSFLVSYVAAMPLCYVPAGQLQGEHTDVITILSFSAKGNLLAAGGLDGRLTIWSTKTTNLLHIVEGHCHSPASLLSLEWVPLGENHVICGLEGGTIISATFEPCIICSSILSLLTLLVCVTRISL